MFINFIFKKEKKSFILFISTLAILIFLGTWQVSRLYEKKEYINKVFKSINSKAIVPEKLYKPEIYDKVMIKAEPDVAEAMWLYRRHPLAKNIEGAYLMLPLKINLESEDELSNHKNSTINYLAILGWFKENSKKQILEEISKIKEIEFEGIFLPSEKSSRLLPGNDYKNSIIFTMDVPEISHILSKNFGDSFIAALNINTRINTNIMPITAQMMISIRNDHLEYAITWYGIALGLCYIYFLYLKRKIKEIGSV